MKRPEPPDRRQLDLFGAPASPVPTPSLPRGPYGAEDFIEDDPFASSPQGGPSGAALPGGQPEPGGPTVAPAPPERATRLELPDALRLESNLALLAGAGTGKTWSLVSICLHLLAGARRCSGPVPPARLGLLTFTDKAAGEMRERLRRRVELLADGVGKEPELEASMALVGRPMPGRPFWQRVLWELGAAPVGTFHSLCAQLLRKAPPELALDRDFELLDERQARDLGREVVERVVLERLEAGDPEVATLVRELGFAGSQAGLVDHLLGVFARVREEGVAAKFLRVTEVVSARAEFDRALERARELVRPALRELRPGTATAGWVAGFAEFLAAVRYESFASMWSRLPPPQLRTSGAACLEQFVRGPVSLPNLFGSCLMAPLEGAVRRLLEGIEVAYETALRRRGALDFSGLLLQARRLLVEFPEARRQVQERFAALLIDEFQDTNRLQLDLVLLLAEQRRGSPRPVTGSFEERGAEELLSWPLEPAFLGVVGDRKQAIYEFRGGDVAVFELMARRIEASGGGRAYLQESRRASPHLVEALNVLMARVLDPARFGDDVQEFEVGYRPGEDDLSAARQQKTAQAPLVRLTRPSWTKGLTGSELRDLDADAVARGVAQLLASEEALVVPRGNEESAPRRARGGDVALLFQRFTHLEVYRQALVRHGIRHRVVRGRGFFGAQEVVDLASLLELIVDPSNALALAAVLRSPLVGLSDESLLRCALDPHTGQFQLRPDVVLGGSPPPGAEEGETRRLRRFQSTFRLLRRERDRVGLRTLLRVAIEELEFLPRVAAAPFGEQAVANVAKLLELAAQRERAGQSLLAFARELHDLGELEPTEAEGEVVDELGEDVVTLCTVHQAKGLEWPVVVLPELFARMPPETDLVRFDRLVGLAVRPVGLDEGIGAATFERMKGLRRRRAHAERLRLLYVALTRARDCVVVGLTPPRSEGWAAVLEANWWADLRSSTRELDVSALPAGRSLEAAGAAPESAAAEVAAHIARVRHGSPARAKAVLLPVTQLETFVSCPRRFHYAHQVGLAEGRQESRWRDDDLDGEESDARARGTAAHRLLELTPLDVVGTPALEERLRELSRTEGLQEDLEVLGWVRRFWESELGARLARAPRQAIHREAGFVVRLGDPSSLTLHLRGQIDLLWDEGDRATVIDYKTSTPSPQGPSSYEFQLACYSLVAQRLLGRLVPVRAGIVYLRQPDLTPRYLEHLPEPAVLESSLVEHAGALVSAQARAAWAAAPRPRCEALGCGYLSRCHPTTTAN